jgi:thiol-disulfide isomerase/thioredoxin
MKIDLLKPIVLVLLLISCAREKEIPATLKTGTWRAVIELQDQQLPFNFEVVNDGQSGYDIYLRNAEEKILLDEVSVTGDTVDIALHVFDANIKASILGDTLKGLFIKNYATDYRVPFTAVYGQSFRFENVKGQKDIPDFSGKYQVTFTNETDTTIAVGIFTQEGDSVVGSFLTPTGDYRYLQGNVVNGKMQLSTFDGNHAYLFTATQKDGKLIGEYYSGKTWKQTWVGIKDSNAALPDAESLTYLKKGYDKIEFSFPDPNGKLVSLSDDKYKNKVVILQIFGTWCPNCMDETKFLTEWYSRNHDRGVEIIGLAFERKPDFGYASDRVKKMIDKFDVPYDFVIAPGTDDKKLASAALPQLNQVVAFPTMIFVGKDGKVRKIHTGFTGPGTREYYEQFKQHFDETINELLREDLTSRR